MQFDSYIRNAENRLKETEQAMASFNFGAGRDSGGYEKLNREHRRLSRLLNCWNRLQKAEKELRDNRELLASESDEEFLKVVQAEVTALEESAKKLERELLSLIVPPLPNEGRNIIVEIRPAAGGEEAGLFAAELHRMYLHFAEQNGWKVESLDLSQSDLGGIRAVSFSLQGEDVYRYLCHESGVHRVQRIPVTEAAGRIHTSTVTVAVLPEAEEVDIQVNPAELRIDVFRSQGPGGQSVNTTDSAVRITHLPTGLVVASQQEKSQHRNREIAMRLLRSRLLERKQAEEDAKNAAERRQQVGTGERSEKIRTYNFPQNRVTDHRYGITVHDLAQILEGRLDDLLSQIVAIELDRRLQTELKIEPAPRPQAAPTPADDADALQTL
ncbi:MAG: peptide chain release factor 1 [Lentisphaerae bacterium RIFOXYB12_FULL_65_16]|nr:MAG: peptide chain release factor 1 [Lentisphaerae bacterium RIFOXYA12_64_32]OGV84964.1 MAG: peptide chain release factor 1 [Lentisphaerae bacterium RIFOXYB12_FULL_65_16]